MSIEGKAFISITPYHDANHDGTAKVDELKRILAKLTDELPIPKMGINYSLVVSDEPLNRYFPDRPGRTSLFLRVPDNLNFWAQLVVVPTLLTPYFWKKTSDELKAERARLVAGGAWARDNWLKLAERFDGTVYVDESYNYDGYAEHEYAASAKWSEDDVSGTSFTTEPPAHADALSRQIANVKAFVAALKAKPMLDGKKVESVTINKSQYWDMFN